MRKSAIARLIAVTVGLMLAALGTLNSGVGTRRVRAFSVLTVTNTNDHGAGSLRDAVNAAAPGDTIMFSLPLPATITLTTLEISIGQDVTIAGPGANLLTVSGKNNSDRVFSINTGTNVQISGLSVADGLGLSLGGGILNQGTLSVTNCTFSNNSLSNPNSNGGAIATSVALTAMGCTFTGNSAFANGGGIFASGGTVSLINSTFSGNSTGGGGGVIFDQGAAVTVVNCTISGNTGEGIVTFPVAGTTLNLQNTIIAGNTIQDCEASGGTIGVNSHNLIGDGSCSPMLSGNPMLGPLQNNGGTTRTMALLAGSPAIDVGDDSVLGSPLFLTTDQRGPGFPRQLGAHVDIGAFEFQVPAGPSFDTCLKDNSTGNLFQFNSTTGQYLFTRCSDSFTMSGTGVVALVNGIRMLTDRKPDRRISAGFSTSQLTGSATIYLKVAPGVWQLFRINDTNPSAVCKC